MDYLTRLGAQVREFVLQPSRASYARVQQHQRRQRRHETLDLRYHSDSQADAAEDESKLRLTSSDLDSTDSDGDDDGDERGAYQDDDRREIKSYTTDRFSIDPASAPSGNHDQTHRIRLSSSQRHSDSSWRSSLDGRESNSNIKSPNRNKAIKTKKRSKSWWICVAVGITILLAIIILPTLIIRYHDDLGFDIPFLDKIMTDEQSELELTDPAAARKALVISSYKAQDVAWLKKVNRKGHKADNWEIYRYVNDAPPRSKDLHVDNPDGREALAYLTFIVDHYDDLPDYIMFTHGHQRAWHQPTPLQYKLWSLNTTALAIHGYFNIRCASKGCTDPTMFYYPTPQNTQNPSNYPNPFSDGKIDHRLAAEPLFREFWTDMLAETFGPIPYRIGRTCCAQFAASRAAILLQPREFWDALRDPLLKKERRKREHPWRKGQTGYHVGMYYENVWHILFGHDAVFCPTDEVCNQVFFSGRVNCTDKPPVWQTHEGWEKIRCSYDEGVEAAQEAEEVEVEMEDRPSSFADGG